MSVLRRVTILTRKEIELVDITPEIVRTVESSGVEDGTVFVLSLHTTTGLAVNEGLPDLEADIADFLAGLVPEERPYRHARFLHSDGQMAINAPAHLRGSMLGFEAFFPVAGGKIVKGSRQTVYFVELDGPQERTFAIHVVGEPGGGGGRD
ncbi:MAG TPA: secondary thiamine-phosphate synthase enzyme YjbQ [Spirochaetales bacterium]|nr:secondary thiamine-phosphate synthase enzyme YjbQ [Spirochaetales bacterium]HRY55699.1 secondary thiamine-phosphate synthase enzyme YjbQ [Spirochaetia bacterium]HRZ64423.1 secondary thiamine-phosphate synthase enzyme YjbQ [Spirochaetia bacterium]